MQASISRPMSRTAAKPSSGLRSVARAIQYLIRYGRRAALPYAFLIVATAAQLAVPSMIRRIIDAVTSGYVADQVLQALDKIPTQFASSALPKILAGLGYPANWTREQLVAQLSANRAGAPQTLLAATTTRSANRVRTPWRSLDISG